MTFEETMKQDLRLVLLRTLNEQPAFTCNESILNDIVKTYGHNKSRNHIKAQLRWLADTDAIEVKEVEGFLIATLKRNGQDHIEGLAIIDGIKRPGPKA